MGYLIALSIGVVLGFITFGLIAGSSTLRNERDTYMEGYIDGLNEGKVK